MAKDIEVKIIDELKRILDNYNISDSEDNEFNSLIKSIEKHFVLDWYTKDSIKASIRSEIRRYFLDKGTEKDVVISVLDEVSRLLNQMENDDKQETQIENEKRTSDEVKVPLKEEIKKSLKPNHYTIILDSNYLYNSYKSGGNLSEFTLNSPFHNLISTIEMLDIYEYVKVGIPEVVYNEIIMQRIEKLRTEVNKIFKIADAYLLPSDILEIKISDRDNYYKEYEDTVREESQKYINEINKSSTVQVIEIPFRQCNLEAITLRAFYKKPPFEGKDKESDKGFKDALIWESILKYKEHNPHVKIVFISEDKEFNETLTQEFKSLFDDKIHIIKKEEESTMLKRITEEIYTAIGEVPITKLDTVSYDYKLKSAFYEWYDSEEFEEELENITNKYINRREKFIRYNELLDKEIKDIEFINEEKIILIMDCNIELENKRIAGEKFEVIERFEFKIKVYEDSFEIENIGEIDLEG